MTLDDLAKENGFDNAKEMNQLIAGVDISNPDNLAKFKEWQEEDGTKEGLLKLPSLPG